MHSVNGLSSKYFNNKEIVLVLIVFQCSAFIEMTLSYSNDKVGCLYSKKTETIELICENSNASKINTCSSMFENKTFQSSITKVRTGNCKGPIFDGRFLHSLAKFRELNAASYGFKEFTFLFNETVNELPDLKKFNASQNKLIQLQSSDLLPLRNLNEADFSFNQIQMVETIKCLKLISLNLSHNNISKLSNETFSSLKDLKFLDLSYNHIETIVEGLFDANKNLKFLHLENNRLKHFQYSGNFTKIQYFNVAHNRLENSLMILNQLGSSLEWLDLSWNFVETLNRTIFPKFVRLKVLKLRHSNLSSCEVDTFQHQMQLEVLDLSYNHLHYVNFSSLPNSNLSELNLSGNKFTDAEIKSIVLNFPKGFLIDISGMQTSAPKNRSEHEQHRNGHKSIKGTNGQRARKGFFSSSLKSSNQQMKKKKQNGNFRSSQPSIRDGSGYEIEQNTKRPPNDIPTNRIRLLKNVPEQMKKRGNEIEIDHNHQKTQNISSHHKITNKFDSKNAQKSMRLLPIDISQNQTSFPRNFTQRTIEPEKTTVNFEGTHQNGFNSRDELMLESTRNDVLNNQTFGTENFNHNSEEKPNEIRRTEHRIVWDESDSKPDHKIEHLRMNFTQPIEGNKIETRNIQQEIRNETSSEDESTLESISIQTLDNRTSSSKETSPLLEADRRHNPMDIKGTIQQGSQIELSPKDESTSESVSIRTSDDQLPTLEDFSVHSEKNLNNTMIIRVQNDSDPTIEPKIDQTSTSDTTTQYKFMTKAVKISGNDNASFTIMTQLNGNDREPDHVWLVTESIVCFIGALILIVTITLAWSNHRRKRKRMRRSLHYAQEKLDSLEHYNASDKTEADFY